jgi:hypothetical protein
MMTLERTLISPTTPLILPPSLAATPVTCTSSRGAGPTGRESALGICREAQGEEENSNSQTLRKIIYHSVELKDWSILIRALAHFDDYTEL